MILVVSLLAVTGWCEHQLLSPLKKLEGPHFFMPLPSGARSITFSGCPSRRLSVISPKYHVSTCAWVRWSIWPTVTVLWQFRLSVRTERFPGVSQRTHGSSGLRFGVLMYPGHLQNWLDYGCGLLIFLLLVPHWLSEMGQIWGFRAFLGERMEGMAWDYALHAYVSWPPSELSEIWGF